MILILLYFAKNEVTYNNPQGIAIFQANEGHDYWTSYGVRNPDLQTTPKKQRGNCRHV